MRVNFLFIDKLSSLPLGPRRGGRPIDFHGLNYQWSFSTAGCTTNLQRPRFVKFAHASVVCHDLEQPKRFFSTVIGGELIHDAQGFAEVRVAGIIIGMTDRPGLATGRNADIRITLFL